MQKIRFDDQVAVITGAGGGLGRTYALELAARGAAVVVNDLGSNVDGLGATHSMADGVVEEISAAGGRAVANYDSVASDSGGEAIVQAALDNFGRLDICINNAGNLRNAPIEDVVAKDFDALHEVHVKGAINVARPAFKVMKRQNYGRMLFTASAAGVFGNELQVAYGSAKTALLGMSNVLALEGAANGIQSNVLLPMAYSRMAEKIDEEKLERLAAINSAFGDAVTPGFIMPLVIYLVSRECTATRAVYSAAAGRYARLIIGLTRGWLGPRDKPASVEDIATHFADIEDRGVIDEPGSLVNELEILASHIRES